MAMSKKQQEEMRCLREDLAAARALGWPTAPKPTPLTAEEIEASRDTAIRNAWGGTDRAFVGWTCLTWESQFRLSRGFSLGHAHGVDVARPFSRSKGCGQFFRTAADAVLFARWELCERFARTLAQLDAAATAADAADGTP